MPQHEKIAILPFRFPPVPSDAPESVQTWMRDMQTALENWKNAQAQVNIQSGISSLDNPSGEGYNLGWDSNGKTGLIFGDVDDDSYMEWSGNKKAFTLGNKVTMKQGDNLVYLPFGIQMGDARDGDAVTFSPAFPSDVIPKVLFGAGGLTWDASLDITFDVAVEVQALNLTNTGFTMSAKIFNTSATTTRTLNFSGGAGVTSDTTTKTLAAEAYNDKYTFDFNVTVAGKSVEGSALPSYASIGLYAKTSGGSYTKYQTIDLVNSTGANQNYSKTSSITVDGLGLNAVFKVQVDSGDATLSCNDVTYKEGAATVSATPSDAPAVPWLAIGARTG